MRRDKWEIVFSGVGGQGLLTSGTLLGEAASIYEKKHAAMSVSYGTETVGTFTKAEVVISDSTIDYPGALEPNVVICLAQVAYERYYDQLDSTTVIIYDKDEVTPKPSKAVQLGFAMKTELDQHGLFNTNMYALGVLIANQKPVERAAVIQAIQSKYMSEENILNSNLKAFEIGYERGQG